MSCHSQIWTNAAMLAPVRESLAASKPIRWNRVHVVPAYVYFDHSIHVAKGVGCSTCHGRVDQMALTSQAAPLTMGWCLTATATLRLTFGRTIKSSTWPGSRRRTRSAPEPNC